MGLYAPIIDGEVAAESTPTNTTKKTTGTSELGKDAFLQLLVAQMENQDPLNPSSDTEFIAQLAQFSSLEQMQNMSQTLTNQGAMSLVGKNVIVAVGSSEGKVIEEVAGYVQYVQVEGGKTYLSINGELYKSEDLEMVLDDRYLDAILNGSGKDETANEESGSNQTESDEESEGI